MTKRRHLTFWQLAEMIPPVLARLLAKGPIGLPLTDAQIAKASGLSVDDVFLLSHLTSWSTVQLPTMRAFLTGCGVDFCNARQMERVKDYLRHRPNFKYLRTSPDWQARYQPLLRRYVKSTTKPQ